MIIIFIWLGIWIIGHYYIIETHKIYKKDLRRKSERRLMKGRKPGAFKKHFIWFIISLVIMFIVFILNPIKSTNNNIDTTPVTKQKNVITENEEKEKRKIKNESNEVFENVIITNKEKAVEVERITNLLKENKSIQEESLTVKPKNKKETILTLIKEGKSNSEIQNITGYKKKEIRKIRHSIND